MLAVTTDCGAGLAGGVVPVPLRATVCGLPAASSAMLRVAVRPPAVVGAPPAVVASALPVLLAAVASSGLFALIHTEQGLVGLVLTFVDALFYCALRLHFRSLWASVLAHGLLNTIGLTAYFLLGPFQTLW